MIYWKQTKIAILVGQLQLKKFSRENCLWEAGNIWMFISKLSVLFMYLISYQVCSTNHQFYKFACLLTNCLLYLCISSTAIWLYFSIYVSVLFWLKTKRHEKRKKKIDSCFTILQRYIILSLLLWKILKKQY